MLKIENKNNVCTFFPASVRVVKILITKLTVSETDLPHRR